MRKKVLGFLGLVAMAFFTFVGKCGNDIENVVPLIKKGVPDVVDSRTFEKSLPVQKPASNKSWKINPPTHAELGEAALEYTESGMDIFQKYMQWKELNYPETSKKEDIRRCVRAAATEEQIFECFQQASNQGPHSPDFDKWIWNEYLNTFIVKSQDYIGFNKEFDRVILNKKQTGYDSLFYEHFGKNSVINSPIQMLPEWYTDSLYVHYFTKLSSSFCTAYRSTTFDCLKESAVFFKAERVLNNIATTVEVSQVSDRTGEKDPSTGISIASIDFSGKINAFLLAEEKRDFTAISSYISEYMNRYYDLTDPSVGQIKDRYEYLWRFISNAKNKVRAIERLNAYTYNLETDFTYYNQKKNTTITKNSIVRFVFNEEGKIIETYSLK